jgi:hypothetical protein
MAKFISGYLLPFLKDIQLGVYPERNKLFCHPFPITRTNHPLSCSYLVIIQHANFLLPPYMFYHAAIHTI